MWSIFVIMPAVQAEFGVSRADVSLPHTATMLGFELGNFVLGRAVDRFGVTLTAAAALFATGFAITSQSGSPTLLATVQFAVSTAAAVGFGILLADMSHWFARRRGIPVAVAGTCWPMVLAHQLEVASWRTFYLVLAVAVLVGILPLAHASNARAPSISEDGHSSHVPSHAKDIGLSLRALQYT